MSDAVDVGADKTRVLGALLCGGVVLLFLSEMRRSSAAKAEESRARRFYDEHKEAGKVFGRGFVDEAAFGLVDPVVSHYSTDAERTAWDEAKGRHKVANIAGRGAGFGTSLFYGGEVAKGATASGKGAALLLNVVKTKAVALSGEAAERAVLKASEEVVVKEVAAHGTAKAVALGAKVERAAEVAAKEAAIATERGATALAAKVKGLVKAGGAKTATFLNRVVRSEMIEIAAKSAEQAVLKASQGILTPENARKAAAMAADAAKNSVDAIVKKIVHEAVEAGGESA